MRSLQFAIGFALAVAFSSCGSTAPVTANPDRSSATSGTTGSAKFTDQPQHPYTDTLTQRTDTAKIKRDSTRQH